MGKHCSEIPASKLFSIDSWAIIYKFIIRKKMTIFCHFLSFPIPIPYQPTLQQPESVELHS